MAGPKSFREYIRENYEQGGIITLFRSLVRAAPRVAGRLLRRAERALLWPFVEKRILSREQFRDTTNGTGEMWVYGEAEMFHISPPEQESLPNPLRKWVGTYTRPPQILRTFPQAAILWEGAPVVTHNGQFVLESAENDRSILQQRIEYALRTRTFHAVVADIVTGAGGATFVSDSRPLFPLVRHPTTNFYHWITEYLPKIRAFNHYEKATGKKPVLIIEPDPPQWVRESLKLFGFNQEDWITFSQDGIRADTVIVPMHGARTSSTPHIPSPRDRKFLREEMSPEYGGNGFSGRVFISRQQAEDRQIENFDLIEKSLSSYGFETYVLETMSLSDQISLFEQAEIIVAPHGAGLTHLLFASDVTIIEIFPTDQIRHHFFCLAMICDIDYYYCLAEPSGFQMSVEEDELSRIIEKIL